MEVIKKRSKSNSKYISESTENESEFGFWDEMALIVNFIRLNKFRSYSLLIMLGINSLLSNPES